MLLCIFTYQTFVFLKKRVKLCVVLHCLGLAKRSAWKAKKKNGALTFQSLLPSSRIFIFENKL